MAESTNSPQSISQASRSSALIAFKAYGALFGRYLKPQWRKALLMSLLLLSSIGLQLLEPQILRLFIDSASEPGAAEALLRAALLFLAIALGRQLFMAWASYLGADVGWAATNGVRRDLAAHTLSLDLSFHTSRTPGELIERLDGDVTALADFFSQFGVRVFGALLLLVGILVVLWLEHALVGFVLTVFAALQLLVMTKTRELAVPATRLEREANAQLFGFIEERLAGLDDLRANGGGAHAMHRFGYAMRDFHRRTRRAWLMRSTIWLTGYGLFVLGMSATIALGIYLSTTGRITVGTAYLVMQYLFMLLTPLEQITQQMQVLQRAGASVGRIGELTALRSALAEGRLPLPEGALGLRFEGVSFAYPGEVSPEETNPGEGAPLVLENLSFELAPGRVLGLLGRTGSGKSTLTRLLFRFYDPSAGRVTLGGVELREAALGDLRQRVGMVTQEVQLFQATLRENLSFFDERLSDERILAVLAELGLLEWLSSLPQGLDTPIAASGGNLSAGEAQLLAFARVFLKDPDLIILDEPSSRLDPATERRLERALDRLLAGRSAIIIAHRLETVARADDILILGEGRVLEHGPRASLERDPSSHFARLLRRGQDLDRVAELA